MFEELSAALSRRGYFVECFQTKEDVVQYLSSQIANVSVGIGGSESVKQLNIYPKLSQTCNVFWHWEGGEDNRKKAAVTDVYISSVNAIATTGELVNIDGKGNRIASILYGHKEVFLIVGKNKICLSLSDAIFRAKNIAAPKNAQRLGKKTPCAVHADKCYDCDSPQRICACMQILYKPTSGSKITVLLVNEELGL